MTNLNQAQNKNLQENVNHIPVMWKEVIQNLVSNKQGFYIDCTFGLGGHTKYLLDNLSDKASVIGIDADYESYKYGIEIEQTDKRFKFLNLNFVDLLDYWKQNNIPKIDGIFFDLGISTNQLNDLNRGFSYKNNGKLDMRIDKKNTKNAAYILKKYSKAQLIDVFKKYGEIKNPEKLTELIIQHRKKRIIESTQNFYDLINHVFPQNKFKFNKNPHKLFFQALRIETNNELKNLKIILNHLHIMMNCNGKVLFLTFNSLEERIIKEWIHSNCKNIIIPDYGQNIENQFEFIDNQYITPEAYEILNNWSSRSAKLWVFRKK